MSTEVIDWDLAVRTATALARPGPSMTPAEARGVVDELRALVPIAEKHVADVTQLIPPDIDIPVAIVDRPGWVRANVDGFRLVMEPLVERVAAKGMPSGAVRAVGSRITGVQLGSIMAYLSSRVLGQFELFLPPGEDAGRLTLVAPNIVEVERRLDVDPHDFRLWVTLHEVTHRTQFTAVTWLRGYFREQVDGFVSAIDLDPAAMIERLRSVAGALGEAARGRSVPSIVELVQSPKQREMLERMQALMSLLEGHGDVVMDLVGPEVVPSVATIRERFDQRRARSNPIDRVIRSLFGLDLKMKQYAEGAAFVRHVLDARGMSGVNAAFASPATLPSLTEIRDPACWLERMDRDAG